eukprot:gene12645-23645_t
MRYDTPPRAPPPAAPPRHPLFAGGDASAVWLAYKKQHKGSHDRNAGQPVYDIACEALRVASGDQRAGKYYLGRDAAREAVQERVMFLCALGCAACSPTHVEVAESLARIEGGTEYGDKARMRAAECDAAVRHGECFRGIGLAFDGGKE